MAFEPWIGGAVVSWTDNTVAMAAMRTMAPKTEIMQEITAKRTEYLFEGEILEEARRITSKANLWADLGSRGDAAAVVQQSAACGLRGTREIMVPLAWRDTSGLCSAAGRREVPKASKASKR